MSTQLSPSRNGNRVFIDEVLEQNYGQQGPGREWTEWKTYEVDENGHKIGNFSYDSFGSAAYNACRFCRALGIDTITVRKEGKDVRNIDVTKTIQEIEERFSKPKC